MSVYEADVWLVMEALALHNRLRETGDENILDVELRAARAEARADELEEKFQQVTSGLRNAIESMQDEAIVAEVRAFAHQESNGHRQS